MIEASKTKPHSLLDQTEPVTKELITNLTKNVNLNTTEIVPFVQYSCDLDNNKHNHHKKLILLGGYDDSETEFRYVLYIIYIFDCQ